MLIWLVWEGDSRSYGLAAVVAPAPAGMAHTVSGSGCCKGDELSVDIWLALLLYARR